jgi:RNA polymerase sigma-70 factor (ECF subfamily)
VTLSHEHPSPSAEAADRRLVEALRRGDEAAFGQLVDMYHASMLRLARSFVSDRAVAEEVVQEAWLGVIRGPRARTTKGSSTPTGSSRRDTSGRGTGPPGRPHGPAPEERLLASEAREVIEAAIETLPESQRQVITLRDVEGWSAEEVCDALEITEVNQWVLLHRARAKVRALLAEYLNGPDAV